MRRRITLIGLFLAIALTTTATTVRAQTAADGQPAADVVDPTPATSAAPAPAAADAPRRPRLDDVFRSMQTRANGTDLDVSAHLVPLAIAGVGFAGILIAISHWNRVRARRPAVVGDHKKLMRELSRATGLSATQLKRLTTLADAAGLASPLVAAIAPSALRDLATRATSDVERMALARLARQVAKR